MALPATDAFTGADGTALTTYSASWTYNQGTFALINNNVRPSNTAQCLARWNADTFNDNQYSKGSWPNVYGNYSGVAVRIDTGGAVTAYTYYANEVDRQLAKIVAGTRTQLGSTGAAPADGNTCELDASGTTITPILNGSTDATIGAQTDSAIASGAAGLSGTGNLDARFDNWEGGDLAGGGGGAPPFIVPILADYYRRKKVQ